MSTDLRTQLEDFFEYLDEDQGAVEISAIGRAGHTTSPYARTSTLPGWAVAALAALAVLIAVGGLAVWVGTSEDGPVDSPVPTSAVVPTTSGPPTTVSEARPDVTAPSPTPTTIPPIEIDQIPMPIVAQATVQSPVGEMNWTVYEGEPSELLQAQLRSHFDATAERRSVDPRLFSTSGALTQAPSAGMWVLASAGGVDIAVSYASIDWVETALVLGGEDLRTRSQNGELLAQLPSSANNPPVEVYLFESPDDARDFANRGFQGNGVPVEMVSSFDLAVEEVDGGWITEVADTGSGEVVGHISSAFEGWQVAELFTVTSPDTLAIFDQPWSLEGHTEVTVVDDLFFAYHTFHNGEGPATVWTSTDGIEWQNRGSPSGWPDGYDNRSFAQRDEVLVAVLVDVDDRHRMIRSEDGLSWSEVSGGPTALGNVYSFGSGWLYISEWFYDDETRVWASVDGTSWELVETLDLPMPTDPFLDARLAEENGGEPEPAGRSGGGSIGVGDTELYMTVEGDGLPTRIWIVEVQP